VTKNPSQGHPYFVLALLTFLSVLNFADRSLISSLAPLIKEDLGLSNTQIGLISGICFVSLYTFVGLAMGALADRLNRAKMMAAGLFLWSAMAAVVGSAHRFWQLAIAQLFFGVGQASLTPPALSMLSDTFPPEKRGFASGVYYAGMPLGGGLSLISAGTIGSFFGWRMCFYITAAIGIVASILIALLLKEAPRGAMEQSHATPHEHHSFKKTMSQVLPMIWRSHAILMAFVGSSIMVFSMMVGILGQEWLIKERGFAQQEAALTFGLLFLIGGVAGNVLGGIISDWFHERWRGGRLLSLVFMQITLMPFLLAFRFIPSDSPMFYVCALVDGMYKMMIFGPCVATAQDLVPIRVRSTVVACIIFCQNFLGAALGAFAVGVTCDIFVMWGFDEPYTWGLFSISVIGFLSIPMFWYGSRCYQRDLERMRANEIAPE
jgi:MFS family permease